MVVANKTEATEARVPAHIAAKDSKDVPPTNIYQILDRVSNEAGALAPASTGGVPFPFRGIDGTVAHLSPLLRKYGVVIVPNVLEHNITSAPSGNKVVTTTSILTRFTFYAPDGTSVEAVTAGLANDYADRSTAQAQSVAFRVALLQVFALPTHSKEPEQTGVEPEAPKVQTPPEAPSKVKELQVQIKEAAASRDISAKEYVALGNKLFGDGWATDEKKLAGVLKAIESGETA